MRSEVAPGQLVSSSSCKCRNRTKFDIPVEVRSGHPANENNKPDFRVGAENP